MGKRLAGVEPFGGKHGLSMQREDSALYSKKGTKPAMQTGLERIAEKARKETKAGIHVTCHITSPKKLIWESFMSHSQDVSSWG